MLLLLQLLLEQMRQRVARPGLTIELRQRHGEFEPPPLAIGGLDHDPLGDGEVGVGEADDLSAGFLGKRLGGFCGGGGAVEKRVEGQRVDDEDLTTSSTNQGRLTINATYPGATYLWQDGSTNATINAAAGASCRSSGRCRCSPTHRPG